MLELYQSQYVDKQFERLSLFQVLAAQHTSQRVLYPGSYVHITPSFVFADVVYTDTDRRAARFFAAPEIAGFIAQHKQYPQQANIRFHPGDYQQGVEEPDASFDLLISQYAGFVGYHCKRYLRCGGLLLANNSHGDAGVIALDPDFQLLSVLVSRDGKYRLLDAGPGYFIPKKAQPITMEILLQQHRGIAYTKSAASYLFIKTGNSHT